MQHKVLLPICLSWLCSAAQADTYILYPQGNTISTSLLSVTDGYVPVKGTDYPANANAVKWTATNADLYPGDYQLQAGAIVNVGTIAAPLGPNPNLSPLPYPPVSVNVSLP